jgi:MoaA/NifB/PqqE/SkfB family radical SAM enzyme
MNHSLYWDNFEKRILTTVNGIKNNQPIPIQRVACFVTKKCNFRCEYCNMKFDNKEMSETTFDDIANKHNQAILHITGGEPSTVKWLYKYLDSHTGIFHLNTNAFLKPPENIKRLKVSFDTFNEKYFNILCNRNAFSVVCNNISYATEYTVVFLTSVLTKESYRNAPMLMRWCLSKFPKLYAMFFSVYKGNNKRFMFDKKDSDIFFNDVKPKLEKEMDTESLNLFSETIDEKFRIIQGKRFPENTTDKPCYLSMSERIYDYDGSYSNCSHLFRDGIKQKDYKKCKECLYGCNRRLVMFNEEVEKRIQK